LAEIMKTFMRLFVLILALHKAMAGDTHLRGSNNGVAEMKNNTDSSFEALRAAATGNSTELNLASLRGAAYSDHDLLATVFERNSTLTNLSVKMQASSSRRRKCLVPCEHWVCYETPANPCDKNGCCTICRDFCTGGLGIAECPKSCSSAYPFGVD
jgi:hypothetical protein